MIFAALIRAPCGARNSWLRSLGWDPLCRVFRGFKPLRPPEEDPSERPATGFYPMVHPQAFDVARDSSECQSDGTSKGKGVNSFAELPVHRG